MKTQTSSGNVDGTDNSLACVLKREQRKETELMFLNQQKKSKGDPSAVLSVVPSQILYRSHPPVYQQNLASPSHHLPLFLHLPPLLPPHRRGHQKIVPIIADWLYTLEKRRIERRASSKLADAKEALYH